MPFLLNADAQHSSVASPLYSLCPPVMKISFILKWADIFLSWSRRIMETNTSTNGQKGIVNGPWCNYLGIIFSELFITGYIFSVGPTSVVNHQSKSYLIILLSYCSFFCFCRVSFTRPLTWTASEQRGDLLPRPWYYVRVAGVFLKWSEEQHMSKPSSTRAGNLSAVNYTSKVIIRVLVFTNEVHSGQNAIWNHLNSLLSARTREVVSSSLLVFVCLEVSVVEVEEVWRYLSFHPTSSLLEQRGTDEVLTLKCAESSSSLQDRKLEMGEVLREEIKTVESEWGAC